MPKPHINTIFILLTLCNVFIITDCLSDLDLKSGEQACLTSADDVCQTVNTNVDKDEFSIEEDEVVIDDFDKDKDDEDDNEEGYEYDGGNEEGYEYDYSKDDKFDYEFTEITNSMNTNDIQRDESEHQITIENENKIDINEKKGCNDTHVKCPFWADAGECEANPNYMLKNCKRSCSTCSIEDLDLGVEQKKDGNDSDKTMTTISLSHDYIMNTIMKDTEFRSILDLCKNEHELCSKWASYGECDANPNYMKKSCSLACRSCDQHLLSYRCPLDPNVTKALEPGDLNKMFERITDVSEGSEYAKYEPVVHSRPDRLAVDEGKEDNELDYKIGPWVVTFESFLTDEECDRLVEMGAKMGYARSTNVGALLANGTNSKSVDDTRTSENSWCHEECQKDPLVANVEERIANFTGIPKINQEHLQLLKYNVGQFYRQHHDYIPFHNKRQAGPRILTFFLYLNDVEEGGGTKFNNLNITSNPKKGKALLWPSVLDIDPMAKEFKTHHEALTVEKGIKYGANSWIHLHDFRGPLSRNCI